MDWNPGGVKPLRHGYEFRIYSSRGGDPSSLSANYINDLALDGEGRLWVATSRGLNLYHDARDHFSRYTHEALPGLGAAFVTALSVDPKGGLWAVTEQKGLYHIDRTLTVHRHFTFDPQDPKGLPENTFWSVLAARDGTLWLGGNQTGLSRLKVVGDRALLLPPITGKVPMDSFIYEVFEASSGTLWVGTRLSGLFRIDPGGVPTAVPLEDPEKGTVASVMGIAEDDKGRIWVGSHGLGVFLIDPTEGRVFQHRHRLIDPASLSGDGITSVFKDKTGLMWVGTNAAGLNKHDPGSEIFTHINTRSPPPFHLTENRTHALLHEENTLWAGTFGGGVARFDFDSGSSRVYHWPVSETRSRTFNFVISLYRDRSGLLWAGTYGEGLKIYDPEADAFGSRDPDPVKPSATVVAMAEDGAGNLWLGTLTGIETLHPHGETDPSLRQLEGPDHSALCFLPEGRGSMWIGFDRKGLGLWEADQKRLRLIDLNEDDSPNPILDLVKDASGQLWVAASRGLYRIGVEGDTFRSVPVIPDERLGSVDFNSLVFDRMGYLWLTTNAGILRYDPRGSDFRLFTSKSGLPGRNITPMPKPWIAWVTCGLAAIRESWPSIQPWWKPMATRLPLPFTRRSWLATATPGGFTWPAMARPWFWITIKAPFRFDLPPWTLFIRKITAISIASIPFIANGRIWEPSEG